MARLAKRTFVAVLVFLALSFAGLRLLDHLSTRPVELSQFTWLNKMEIYTAYVLMNVLGAPLYPEIAKEASLMLLPSSDGQEMTFESDFFLESRFIQNALDNYSEPVRLAWPPNSYGLGNAEARIALALNTGTLYVEDGKVKISGFGTFKILDKKQRIGRNPKTQIEYKVSARKVVTFNISQEIKKKINS